MAKKEGAQGNRGDVIKVNNIGAGAAVAAGRNASAEIHTSPEMDSLIKELAQWRTDTNNLINKDKSLRAEDKSDAKIQVAKVEDEIKKASDADPSRLEKLLNMLGTMAPEIFDVAITTLCNPLAGIGLVCKKIGNKATIVKAESKPG